MASQVNYLVCPHRLYGNYPPPPPLHKAVGGLNQYRQIDTRIQFGLFGVRSIGPITNRGLKCKWLSVAPLLRNNKGNFSPFDRFRILKIALLIYGKLIFQYKSSWDDESRVQTKKGKNLPISFMCFQSEVTFCVVYYLHKID
jgi:hypothetical protein